MAYPKPLSEKTLLRMYAEAKISNEKKQFLHSQNGARTARHRPHTFTLTQFCNLPTLFAGPPEF